MLDLHENRTEEAKNNAKKALEMSRRYHSTNDRFLLSKVKYVWSALARREGDYGKAKELLDDSMEVNFNISNFVGGLRLIQINDKCT